MVGGATRPDMVVHVAGLFLLPALLSRRGRRSYKARCFRGEGAAPTKISRPNSYMVGGATRPDMVVHVAGLFLLPALLSRRGRRSYKARCFRGEGAAPTKISRPNSYMVGGATRPDMVVQIARLFL